MTITIGQFLGNYRIIEEIAQGGMATVYKAHQPLLGRDVAIKVILPAYTRDPTFLARFRQEAATVASLRHPHILTVYDFGEENGTAYLVTELVDGGTLRDRLGVALSVSQASALLRPVASALDYAHGRGIVHRDVKPSNVLLHRDGTPILSDFGLVRVLETLDSRLTMTGQLIGTPSYMAPEQALGQEVGPFADIYALAVVAYEMLTGGVPFTAATPVGVMMAHIGEPLRPARDKNPSLAVGVEGVLLKGLAKQPTDRYQKAGDMIRALDDASRGVPPGDDTTLVSRRPPAGESSRFDRSGPPLPPISLTNERAAARDNEWWTRNRQRLMITAAAVFATGVLLVGLLFVGLPSLMSGSSTTQRATPVPSTQATVVIAAPLATATVQIAVQPTRVPDTAVPTRVPPTLTPAPSPTPAPAWVVFAGGSAAGTEPGEFDRPMGVRIDRQGNVWVMELSNNRIQKLSPTGQPLAQFGAKGGRPGDFDSPAGLALDAEGNVYVVEWGNNRVQKLSAAGKPLGAWGGQGKAPGQFDAPSGIAVDGDGNIYVADHNNHRIQKLSPSGEPLAQWGTKGTAPGEFNHPASVALDAQGNIYVADVDNHRIQKLSPTGTSLAVFGKQGQQLGQFNRPGEVELDSTGAMYVADTGNNRIQKLSPTGEGLVQWGNGQGSSPVGFNQPQDVTVDQDGNIYVADMDNHQIQRLPAARR